jgi:uncharacterized protein YyaL (SSP411 family)
MITQSNLREIVAEMKARGYDVAASDICYYLLCELIEDERTVYKALYGERPEEPYEVYTISNKTQELKNYLDGKFQFEGKPDAGSVDELSFDDLKQGLVEDMNALLELRDSVDDEGRPVLDPKEMASVVRQIADIRVKLTEKFGTTEKSEEQRVVVLQKYDSICPYCGREIALGRKS